MNRMVICECGADLSQWVTKNTNATNCPRCRRPLPGTDATAEMDDEPEDSPLEEETETSPPLLLRMLLDPTTIRRLLFFGGTLTLLGIIAWLISLGVFKDPHVMAIALGTGSLALMSSGWMVTLRTRYRLAGQAVTFLACVVAPLNLWFYDAQGMLTVDGHLWVAGVVCTLLYLTTVWMLRDPLFLYAFEAGITLTTLLVLGDLGRATDSSSLCLALTVLAAISIHSHRIFDPNHPTFNRQRFGLPLFFSGQAQLAAATLSLLVLHLLHWIYPDSLLGELADSHIFTQPWLAASIWLVAGYLWIYSDLGVRQLRIYSYLAAFALIMAEVTLCQEYLTNEALIIVLSVTALVVELLPTRKGIDSRSSLLSENIGSLIRGIPFVIGVVRYLQHAIPGGAEPALHPVLYPIAMFVVAAMLGILGQNRRESRFATLVFNFSCASIAGWLGLLTTCHALGISPLEYKLPLILLFPLAGMLALRTLSDSPFRSAWTLALHIGLLVGLRWTFLSPAALKELQNFIQSEGHNQMTLLWAATLFELAAFSLLTQGNRQANLATRALGSLLAVAALGRVASYLTLSEVWYGPILCATGLVALIRERLMAPQASSQADTTGESKSRSDSLPIGDFLLSMGELVSFLQGLSWMAGSLSRVTWSMSLALLVAALLIGLGLLVSKSPPARGLHLFSGLTLLAITAVIVIRLSQLAPYQKLEIAIEFLGVALLTSGFIGRLQEKKQQRETGVSLALWMGSLAATLPVFICTIYHRCSSVGPVLGDEIALITITSVMISLGCILQIRSTTLIAGATLVIYLAVLFARLVYHPQVAIGVYLAAGGAVIFLLGVALSVYRERLLSLPSRIANREGIFQIIDWR